MLDVFKQVLPISMVLIAYLRIKFLCSFGVLLSQYSVRTSEKTLFFSRVGRLLCGSGLGIQD